MCERRVLPLLKGIGNTKTVKRSHMSQTYSDMTLPKIVGGIKYTAYLNITLYFILGQ